MAWWWTRRYGRRLKAKTKAKLWMNDFNGNCKHLTMHENKHKQPEIHNLHKNMRTFLRVHTCCTAQWHHEDKRGNKTNEDDIINRVPNNEIWTISQWTQRSVNSCLDCRQQELHERIGKVKDVKNEKHFPPERMDSGAGVIAAAGREVEVLCAVLCVGR